MSLVRFRILGSLEVEIDSRPVGLGGPKPRALLALLLLHANRPVAADLLVELLWGEPTPPGGVKRLHVVVARLRRAFGDADQAPLKTVASGYLLSVGSEELDAAVFEQLTERGLRALSDGNPARAAEELRRALGLWRGPALADVAYEPFAQSEIRRLEELQLTALEGRMESDLALGRHHDVAAELERLVADNPLRERLRAQLMLALYRAGRQAHALEAFQQGRRVLVEELGLEPGPILQELHAAILAHAPALELPDARLAPVALSSDRKELPALPRALEVARSGRCVARENELSLLMGRWRRVRGSERHAVMLGGEAGIGKTRLAAELAHAVSSEQALTLYGRCDEGLVVPYQPFVEALRPYVNSVGLDQLREHLGGLIDVLTRLWPELFASSDRVSAEPEAERLALFEAVAGVLEAASSERPVVLILDDLHWAPEPTLVMLQQLLRSERSLRALVIGIFRAEDVVAGQPLGRLLASLHREQHAERFDVGGIDEAATAVLVAGALGGRLDQRARELAGVLHDRTAGNPYFIRELIAHLEESGSTIAAPAGDMGAELDLPDGLLNVIAQRVARLSDGARLTLDAAAVAGQRFSLALLERVLSDAPTTLDAIEEATAAGLLTDVGHGEYGFAHALVREAVYQRLTSGRRSRLHRRIGEALEADVSAARVEALAHHFAKAAADGQELKAARYAIAAARDAMQRLGYEEAVSHCRRGLEALARTASQFPRERGELLVTLGEAWWSIGDVEAAQQVCLEASELAESLGDPLLLAQAALVFAGPLWIPSSDEAARPSVELLESALAGLAPDQLRSALGARVMARLSACLVPGDADARRTSLSARGLEIAREIGDAATLANALAMRHWVSAGPDNVEDQLAIASELAAVAQSLGDRRQELEARVWVLDHQLERANADGVRRELAVLQRLAENLDDRRARWILIIATGRQAHLAGRLEEFEALAHQGLASSIQGEDESATQIFGGQMIALRREQQRLDEVVETLERFVGDFPAVVVWRSTLAYVYAELGRHAQARDQLDWLSQESFTRVPRDTWWLSSAAMLAEVAAALDDAPRAQELYDALLPYSDRCVVISGTLCQGAVARLLGLLATTIDQFDEAERHLAAARDINAAVGARLWLLHTRYNEASMLLRRANPGDRDRARDILDDVVSSATPLGLSTLETRARASLGSIIQAGRSPATPRP